MDRDELARMLGEGLSLEAIGRAVGKHPSTVGYWVQKHGLEAAHRVRHRARGALDRDTLSALVDDGLTIREIAARLDRSTATVRHWLRRYELSTAHRHPVVAGLGEEVREVSAECPKHGPTLFIRRGDGAWRCLKCRSASVIQRRKRVKQILVEEAGGCCAICGYDRSSRALEFHHLDPATKRFDVSRVAGSISLARMREEAAKCVLLCSNCHVEVEDGVAALPS